MDSYVIAETLLYAFLTFDDALRHWYDGPPLRDDTRGCDGSTTTDVCRLKGDTAINASGAFSTDDSNAASRWNHGDSRPHPLQQREADCECDLLRERRRLDPAAVDRRNTTQADDGRSVANGHVAALSVSSDGQSLVPVSDALISMSTRSQAVPAVNPVGSRDNYTVSASPRSARCFYVCSARRRFPGAHPLFFRRSDEPKSTASDPSAAAPLAVAPPSLVLPVSDSHALFTTEGHPLLLWPELLTGRPPAAATDARFTAQLAHARASAVPAYSWVHRGGLPRPVGTQSAESLPWAYSRRRAQQSKALGLALPVPSQSPLPRELHVSVPSSPVTLAHSMCRVSRLRSAVDAYTSIPPPPAAAPLLAITDGGEPRLKRERETYPWRGSADIIPSTEEGRGFDAVFGRAMLIAYGVATTATAQLSAAVQVSVRDDRRVLPPLFYRPLRPLPVACAGGGAVCKR